MGRPDLVVGRRQAAGLDPAVGKRLAAGLDPSAGRRQAEVLRVVRTVVLVLP